MMISWIIWLGLICGILALGRRAEGARRTFAFLVAIQIATAGTFMTGGRPDCLWLYQWGLFDIYLLLRLIVIPMSMRASCPRLPNGGRPIILLHPIYTGVVVSFWAEEMMRFIDDFKANIGLDVSG